VYRKTSVDVIDINLRDGEKLMARRVFDLSRIATLVLFGLCFAIGFGAAPAVARGCGYGCYAPAPVVVQPYYYQSCSCCGCGSVNGADTYPAPYAAYAAEYDEQVVVIPRLLSALSPLLGPASLVVIPYSSTAVLGLNADDFPNLHMSPRRTPLNSCKIMDVDVRSTQPVTHP
jgi:hypothetical protein